MKSIKKFLFIMAALAAVLAFVSCSNGDDGGGSSNNNNDRVIAVYESKNFGTVKSTHTITFFDNDTWIWETALNDQSKDLMSGTYTGDPSKDGDVIITITKGEMKNNGELVDISEDNIIGQTSSFNAARIVEAGDSAILKKTVYCGVLRSFRQAQ